MCLRSCAKAADSREQETEFAAFPGLDRECGVAGKILPNSAWGDVSVESGRQAGASH